MQQLPVFIACFDLFKDFKNKIFQLRCDSVWMPPFLHIKLCFNKGLLKEPSTINTKSVKLVVNFIFRTYYLEGFCVTCDCSRITSVMHD